MKRPNILFIFTDEQRYDTMAAYGNAVIETPNLDRLAAQSTVFEQAYVTQPVCTPSRSTLLTGLWPHTNGCTANNIPLRAETPCLPQMLPDGYATCYDGKWHLGDEIFAQHGFDEWISIEDQYSPYYSENRPADVTSSYHDFLVNSGFSPRDGKRFSRPEACRMPGQYTKAAFVGREACRYMREHRNETFCLFVNFLEPHMPFFGPRDDQHDIDNVPVPDNFDTPPGPDAPLRCRAKCRELAAKGFGDLPLRTEMDWRHLVARYWGLVAMVDDQVGLMMRTLEDLGLADDTIVVYTSDHGDMMGSHRLLAKTYMYEESVRVPMMVRLPGQSRGRRVTGPVSQLDVAPTLLDLVGVAPPKHLQGRSLRPWLEDREAVTDDVFIEWNGSDATPPSIGGGDQPLPEYMAELGTREELRAGFGDPVRTIVTSDGWKFCCSPLGEHQLYDLNADPGERINLAADPANRQRMTELRERIVAWQEKTCDAVELPTLG